MGSSLFQNIATAVTFILTFIAFVHVMIGLCTAQWLREVDAGNSPYFERVRNFREHEWFPTYEDLFQAMGLWEVRAFNNEYYQLPIRDYELILGSTCLILSCACGIFVYITFSFQLMLKKADYTMTLFLMIASLWFSLMMFVFSMVGTSVCFWYFRRNMRWGRFGYSHNIAWIGFGFTFFALVFAILRFIVHKKDLERITKKLAKRNKALLRPVSGTRA